MSKVFAVDTEYYSPEGLDLRAYSPASHAIIHCWSVCWGPGDDEYLVLWPDDIPAWKGVLEDPGIVKACHNGSVEYHAFQAHGVTIRGMVDTLALARWRYPGRDPRSGGNGWGLEALAQDFCGEGKTESFKELTTDLVEVWERKETEEKQCRCETWDCPERGAEGHRGKFLDRRTVEVLTSRVEERTIPLQDIVKGHPRYERLLAYSAKDARLTWPVYNYLTRSE